MSMAATDKLDEHKQRTVSDASSFAESDLESVGVQIKLEEGHAIKYRTCSWQKVRISFRRCAS